LLRERSGVGDSVFTSPLPFIWASSGRFNVAVDDNDGIAGTNVGGVGAIQVSSDKAAFGGGVFFYTTNRLSLRRQIDFKTDTER
jgi:hypothetical protein